MLYKVFTDTGTGGISNSVVVTSQALQRYLNDVSVSVVTIFKIKDGTSKTSKKENTGGA